MKSIGSVEINCPIDVVFDRTINHVEDWCTIVVSDEVVQDCNNGDIGTTFRTITEEKGRRMEFDGRVTRHSPPHAHSIHMVGDGFEIEVDYDFDDLMGGTRVTQTSTVHGKGVFKLIFAVLGWAMKRSHCKTTEEQLGILKQICEAAV